MIFYLKAEVYTVITSSTPILRIIRFPNNADVWEECYLRIGYFTASQPEFGEKFESYKSNTGEKSLGGFSLMEMKLLLTILSNYLAA